MKEGAVLILHPGKRVHQRIVDDDWEMCTNILYLCFDSQETLPSDGTVDTGCKTPSLLFSSFADRIGLGRGSVWQEDAS